MENQVNHIAIILDGNRRYAKARGMPSHKGHEKGAEVVEKLFDWCRELDIKEVTLYTLSTENLKRTKKELNYMFNLLKSRFKKLQKDKRIHENQIKIRFIGNLSLVPKDVQKIAKQMEKETKNYNKFRANFCFAYGGRLELLQAINKLKNKKGKITEKDVEKALWLSSEPDLIIRTGNRIRTSNFLPWQAAYSEWVFLKKMWPEFTKADLKKALAEFKKRKRNFGK